MSTYTDNIPVLDLSPEIDNLWNDLNAAIQEVLRSGRFIMGPFVKDFEAKVADFLGVKYAIGVNSGTDALVIGLRAAGIKPGDEVITTPFTFFATAESISIIGAKPVFIDIDPDSFNLDPSKIEDAITGKTKGIVPVHLYGNPAAMGEIMAIARKHNLIVVEDCAQSFGATYTEPGNEWTGRQTGTIGHVGAFSFFPSKNLGAYGDGGLIVTNDDKIADVASMMRVHGAKKKYHNEILGYNSRLDSIQAAILNVKLPYIREYNQKRLAVARRYNELLKDTEGVITPAAPDGHVFHQYTIRLTRANRDTVQQKLKEQGVSSMIYYPVPCNELPVYKDANYDLPQTDLLSTQVLSLPIWPQMGEDVQNRVVEVLKSSLA